MNVLILLASFSSSAAFCFRLSASIVPRRSVIVRLALDDCDCKMRSGWSPGFKSAGSSYSWFVSFCYSLSERIVVCLDCTFSSGSCSAAFSFSSMIGEPSLDSCIVGICSNFLFLSFSSSLIFTLTVSLKLELLQKYKNINKSIKQTY